ncbi:fascin domain-containing protein singed isoform X2 [Brevipalpus obovatus]|uniref:fascin domain-containing protein singed isoform X2 n=1 Tax=Brevipalpus obovatus TaxID=246614 RepID=UPI003D9E2011
MWTGTVGLVNGQHKYLTAETFGYKINANGSGLKKKQLFSLEAFPVTGSCSSPTNGNGNGNSINYEELSELENVAIKSHLGCYLAVDNFGNVTCESKERTEGARFTINICAISSEKGNASIYWAFKNVSRGYYLGTSSDGMICCTAKQPQSRSELWNIHLIPARGATMFALKSIGRKRYARASKIDDSKDGEQVQVDATTPWSSETLFQFKYYEGGLYALLTSSCKYLTSDGNCVDVKQSSGNQSNGIGIKNGSPGATIIATNGNSTLTQATSTSLPPAECLFTIEYHGGFIAFRDQNGRYLACSGRASVLRTRATNVSRDELFIFEEAPIQIALRAAFNDKWVSVKQGVDLSANQNEITSQHETFQLQYNKSSDTWHILTKDGNYWALGAASTIQASSRDEKNACYFKLKWNADGTTSILLSSLDGKTDEANAKWICNRKSGQLCTGVADPVKFYLMFRNRTSLNLRAANGSGFVGLKSAGSSKLESNKTSPDSIIVEYSNSEATNGKSVGSDGDENGFNSCLFKMPANGKYWSVIEANMIACDVGSPSCAQRWIMELRNGCSIAIRTLESTTSYIQLTLQGAITMGSCQPENATLWEF